MLRAGRERIRMEAPRPGWMRFLVDIGDSRMRGFLRASRQRVLIGVLLLLAACAGGQDDSDSSPAPTPPTDSDRVLRLAVSDPLPMLDPFLQHTAIANWILFDNVVEGLVRVLDDEPRPSLATHWSQLDEKTWVFEIRRDVVFHDGSRMTAEHVVASIDRALNHPDTAISGRVGQLEEVSVRDANSILLRLAFPSHKFLRDIAMVPIVANGSSPEVLDPPVATGPYRIVTSEIGRELVVESHPGYWGETPQFDRAEFLFVAGEEGRLQLLEDGVVAIANEISAVTIGRIETNPDLWIESSFGTHLRILHINHSVPPFDDPRVREAIDLALDREAFALGPYGGYARVAGQIALPGSVGYIEDFGKPSRNLERARELVKEVSRGGRVVLELHCGEPSQLEGVAIAAQLEEAGFGVGLIVTEWSSLYERLQAGEIPFAYYGWANYSGDADSSFVELLHSVSPGGQFGKSNHGRYSNPEVDRLIRASRATSDMVLRRRMLEEVGRIVAKDRPIIPLVRPLNIFGVRRDLSWVAPPNAALTLSQMRLDPSAVDES